jgi:hypothetical protein
VCASVFQGTFVIQNQLDVATIAPYCEITGNLTIGAVGLTSVSLPLLQKVGGILGLHGDLTSVSLPSLGYSLGVLADAQSLPTLSLPALTFADALFITYSAISMPALKTLSKLSLTQVPSADLSGLVSVSGDVGICAALTTLTVPSLATIGGELGLGQTSLATLSMPALTSIGLGLAAKANAIDFNLPLCGGPGNASLTQLQLPMITNLGSGNTGIFHVGFNPALPQCRIDAVATQLAAHGWTGTVVSVNLGPAFPCP